MTTPTDPNDPYRPGDRHGVGGTGAGSGYDTPPAGARPGPEPVAPPYGEGGYGAAPTAPGYPPAGYESGRVGAGQNGLGTAALVVGIFAVIFGIVFFPLGLLLGLVGIGLGIAGRRRVRRGEATNGGAAVTGLVLSVVGLLIAIAFAVFVGYIFSQAEDCTDPGLSDTERRQCVEEKLGS